MEDAQHRRAWVSKADLQRWQAEQLQKYLVETVLPFSKHYGQLGIDPRQIRSLDDLRRLPFSSKIEVQDHLLDFILKPDPQILARRPSTVLRALWRGRAAVQQEFEREYRPLMMTFTTGRSSEPVAFVYTGRDIDNLRRAGKAIMEICGATREMRMVNMFPFAPHLAFWLTHYAGTEFGAFVTSTGGGKAMGTEGNLRLIKRLNPDVLIGMPTFMYHILHEAIAHGVRCPKLMKIVLGGEKVPVGMRRKLKALAAEAGATEPVKVLGIYGFTEAKMAWPECAPPEGVPASGYHLFPELGIIELVNPKTGEPVAEGAPGEVVFTPLDARGTVVLRYRTGDVAEGGSVYGPCPHCGRWLPRLVGPISRSSEVKEMRLEKLKGTLVDFNELEHVLDNVESVGTWQVEIRKAHDDPLELDELILHVLKANGEDDDHVRAELRERFMSALEVHPNKILFHKPEEMRQLQGVGVQMKEQRVVDHRPTGRPNV